MWNQPCQAIWVHKRSGTPETQKTDTFVKKKKKRRLDQARPSHSPALEWVGRTLTGVLFPEDPTWVSRPARSCRLSPRPLPRTLSRTQFTENNGQAKKCGFSVCLQYRVPLFPTFSEIHHIGNVNHEENIILKPETYFPNPLAPNFIKCTRENILCTIANIITK